MFSVGERVGIKIPPIPDMESFGYVEKVDYIKSGDVFFQISCSSVKSPDRNYRWWFEGRELDRLSKIKRPTLKQTVVKHGIISEV